MNIDTERSIMTPQLLEPPLLAGLIRSELVEWTKQLGGVFEHLERMRLDGLMPTTLSSSALFDKSAQLTQDLTGKMETLACLAETYGGQNDPHHERFFLSSLLSEILEERADNRWPRFAIKPHGTEVAPVYGNKQWMRTFLLHLLRELELNIGAEQKVVFSLRQLGNYVLLVCRDESLPAHDRNRPRPPLPPASGLTFSLCRRIAELQGGTVRLDTEEEFEKTVLTGFTLSLPTSAEANTQTRRCEDCPLIEQIEQYASDLAVLIDRCHELEEERDAHGKAVDRR